MRRPHPFNVAHGIAHLFGAGFATPRRHRGKLRRWDQGEDVPEKDVREILDAWGQQQDVSWKLARALAWGALAGAVWSWAGKAVEVKIEPDHTYPV